jgi:hypothetical protein
MAIKLLNITSNSGTNLALKGLDAGFTVIVARAYIEVPVAGIDLYTYLNGSSFGVGIDAKVEIRFGLNSIACTNIYGSATACVNLFGEIVDGSVNAGGCAGLSTQLSVEQMTPLLIDCVPPIFKASIDFKASMDISLHPWNVNFNVGSNNCSICQ